MPYLNGRRRLPQLILHMQHLYSTLSPIQKMCFLTNMTFIHSRYIDRWNIAKHIMSSVWLSLHKNRICYRLDYQYPFYIFFPFYAFIFRSWLMTLCKLSEKQSQNSFRYIPFHSSADALNNRFTTTCPMNFNRRVIRDPTLQKRSVTRLYRYRLRGWGERKIVFPRVWRAHKHWSVRAGP